MKNNSKEHKNVSLDEEVLKVLFDLLNSLEQSIKQARESLTAVILKAVEEQASSHADFVFPRPLRRDAGFERLLLKVLESERSKHPEFTYQLRRNEQGEIVAVEAKGPSEYLEHVLRVCSWIKRRLLAQNSKS